MPETRLSVVVITHNASATLSRCLKSADFADETLVVDCGSDDDTAEIARAHGARLLLEQWRGFGAQKQFASEQASYDWVLCLDSDEVVSDSLRHSIELALSGLDTSQTDPAAFSFARRNHFLGRALLHGEGYPDLSLRLFDRRRAHWSDDTVHEKVVVNGEQVTLAGDLLHYSGDDLTTYLSKQNRYSTLAAQSGVASGQRASMSRALGSALLRFVKYYLLRRGFLDGWPGLVHILIGCSNSFFKYVKMLEINNKANTKD